MLSSIFSAFSGMLGFSKGLDVISNNVANMNTPGFKASELRFRDMFYRYGLAQGGSGSEQVGQGVDTGTTRTKYAQGELRTTDNTMDTAIDGNGFFILRKDGDTFYTRNGQFEFNSQGVLVEHDSQARVAALNGGQLMDISIAGLRVNPSRATSEIVLTGNLDRNAAATSPYTLSSVSVIDGSGNSHTLSIVFTNNNATTSGSWLVEVREGTTVLHSGEIRYQGSGTPQTGFSTLSFAYAPSGATSTDITLNFGTPGTSTGTTSLSGPTSNVSVSSQNGFAAGSLIESSFGTDGVLTLEYSNGQTTTHDRLALAWFEDLQSLTLSGGNLFSSARGQSPIIAGANEKGMGAISSKHIELSNVELTEQFTDMVVIQRGYQASSQVISVANEMTQQLLDLRGRR